MPDGDLISINDLPCCPEITRVPCCESLRISYRLTNRQLDVPVEVVIVAELERCPGPLSLGDVVFSTTLLPGEKVRLYTSTRNNRFTYDAESEVSYRHEQSSEETYYMRSMDRYMSDLTVTDSGSASSSSHSDFETDVDGSYASIGFAGGGSVNVEGDFNSRSASSFMRQLSSHARSSHDRSVQATRAANSVQMGEVQSRSHAEGESESAYEASTRTFENKNECHAVTYFAYQLVKKQTLRFRIVSVLRRVVDAAASSAVEARPVRPATGIKVLPNGVLATKTARVEVEAAGRTAAAAQRANIVSGVGSIGLGGGFGGLAGLTAVATPFRLATNVQPVPPAVQDKVLKQVDDDLVKEGILAKAGSDEVGARLAAELNFERTYCLPTQGIVVKGCLDRCNTCEESRQKSIALDLVRKDLENQLLAKQIALLEKSQEYRCCPVGEAEPEDA
ncbi:MAG: hypothetical protein H6897_07345 [Rhodobacteraceae bacterium]|jgi:hypothetical protein|uniref:hypothetical protein n=1 Tax=Albidovulum sp. TaxID=1872424 RepID=UPI001DE6E90E|nr:hypothetical protein [uncultured Defluviimonas sp.]MCB2124616.1 hypothetical protein [Paracoccaceae bacterium]MCC0069731.1 hypothetical protein [Paracoccaceae bacterium]